VPSRALTTDSSAAAVLPNVRRFRPVFPSMKTRLFKFSFELSHRDILYFLSSPNFRNYFIAIAQNVYAKYDAIKGF